MENPNVGWTSLQFLGDRTWDGRSWTKLDQMMPAPGAGPMLTEPLREPFKNQVFGAVLGVVVLLPFSLWTLTALKAHPLEAGLQLAVLLPLLAWSLYLVLKTHTRRPDSYTRQPRPRSPQ